MPGRLTLRPLCLALFASVAIPALPVQAAEYGDFAYDTLRTLTIDHAGRHSGTEAFEDAAMPPEIDNGEPAQPSEDPPPPIPPSQEAAP